MFIPIKLIQAFNQSFAELLANVLYQQVSLRPTVCHALTNLVDKNLKALELYPDEAEIIRRHRLTLGEVQQNVNLLTTFAANFLSILFNVFSQTAPTYRSPLADCIKAFLRIALPEVDRDKSLLTNRIFKVLLLKSVHYFKKTSRPRSPRKPKKWRKVSSRRYRKRQSTSLIS